MKRFKVNDPVALREKGLLCYNERDDERAFEYLTKAAALGDMDAHYNLSILYYEGRGVERDKKKEIYHLEEAAIGGHHLARHNLACAEAENGRFDRATKHSIIAANLGFDVALEQVKKWSSFGFASKEDYEDALRGHQTAVDATKSTQRDAGEEYYRQKRL
jgi:TPR repeat protein